MNKSLYTFLLIFISHWAVAQLTVTGLVPGQNANYAAIDANIEITFSAAVDATTLAGNILVKSDLQGGLPFTVSGGGTAVITIDPDDSFLYGDKIHVLLKSGIQSVSAAPLTNGFGYSFRVKTLPSYSTSPTLKPQKLPTYYAGSKDLTVADMDSDGEIDLLTLGGGSLYWYKNDGSESFSAYTQSINEIANIGGGNSFDMHLDDLDYDGDVDVIYEELAMDLFKWLENDAASFTEHDVSTAVDGPNVLASGDLNNDGLVDIAYTSNNGLQLAFNNGSGEFTLVDIEGEQFNGKLVGLVDMDGDGDIDLVCQGTSSRCFWYENDGTGNMTQHILGSSVSFMSYIDPVDLDDDGDMDLIISSDYNDEYYWYENNGSQSFSKHLLSNDADAVHTIKSGDLDGDGDMDILTTYTNEGKVVWLENNGSENFIERVLADNFSSTKFTNPADLNLDGRLDLVVYQSDGIYWFENKVNEDPVLENPIPDQGAQAYISFEYTVAADAFSDPDLMILNYAATLSAGDPLPGWLSFDADLRTFSGTPGGSDAGTIAVKVTATDPAGAAVSDEFDLEITVPSLMTLDSYAPEHYDQNVSAGASLTFTFSGNIDNTTLTPANIKVRGSMSGLITGSFSGGGTPTIQFLPGNDFLPGERIHVMITTDLKSEGGGIIAGNKSYYFDVEAALPPSTPALLVSENEYNIDSTPTDMVEVDLDKDGDLDVLTSSRPYQRINWHVNDGAGNFTVTYINHSGVTSCKIDVADIDQDGDNDIVVFANSGGAWTWLENDGSQVFTSHVMSAAMNYTLSVSIVDLNQDGSLDVLATESGSDNVLWFKNDGAQNFTQLEIGTFGTNPNKAYAEDLDQDGDIDVVVGGHNYGTNFLAWYENDGSQGFTYNEITQTADGVSDVDVADVDGDGDMDILTAEDREDHVVIYQNNGNQSFTALEVSDDITGPVQACFVDLDADDDLDIVIGADGVNAVGWLENKGGFNFTYWELAANEGNLIGFGDLDGDSDLDLVSVSEGTNKLYWYQNKLNETPVVSSPKSDEEVVAGVAFSIDMSGIFSDPDGSNTLVYAMTMTNGNDLPDYLTFSNTSKTLTGTAPYGSDGTYTLRVIATDHAGEAAFDDFDFTVSEPPLISVVSFTPLRGSYQSTDAGISITFDKNVDASTLSGSLMLYDDQGQVVSGDLGGGGTATITFTPAVDLVQNREYTVVLSDQLEAEDGSIRTSPFSFYFKTAASPAPGAFVKQSTLVSHSFPLGLDLGDLDGDDDLDITVPGGTAATANLLVSAGADAGVTKDLGVHASSILIFDLDQDGDLDVISTTTIDDKITLNKNDGAGNFTITDIVPGITDPEAFRIKDMDMDGDFDLIVVSHLSVDIYQNNGSLTFTKLHVSDDDHTALEVLDYDLDGDLDILGGENVWYENDGLLSFISHSGFFFDDLEMDDIDGDGDQDIVVSHANNLTLYNNDGTGSYAAETLLSGQGTGVLKVVDLNGDGHLDVVTSFRSDNALFFLENDGSGAFTSALLSDQESDVIDFEVGDLNGDGNLDIIVCNYGDNEVTWFKNRSNADPTVDNAMANQETNEDALFTFSIPENTFADADEDELSLSASLTDESALPDWLSFDPASHTFSGTPLQANVGTISIRVTADDGLEGIVSDDFDITVNNVNDAPVVNQSISTKTALTDLTFSFEVPTNTFEDEDEDVLTLTAGLSDGSALPDWLSFDGSTKTFDGTPTVSDVANHTVRVTATDPSTSSVYTDFTLKVTLDNDPPVVAAPVPDLEASEDQPFQYSFAANTFTDPDDDLLTYSMTLQGGDPLPSWLTFEATDFELSGTPLQSDVNTYTIVLTAADEFAEVSDEFVLTVNEVNDAPFLVAGLPDHSVDVGEDISIVISESAFSDEDHAELIFSITMEDGSDLPSWLTFDAASRTLSGTSSLENVGQYSLRVTASDGEESASDVFVLTVISTNSSPVVRSSLSLLRLDIGDTLTLAMSTLFEDPNGDDLSFESQLFGGAELPDWIVLAEDTLIITPTVGTLGEYTVEIIASDPFDESVSMTFDLEVSKSDQTISFTQIASEVNIGAESIPLEATASSGLEVVFSSSNTDVAMVEGGFLEIIGAGSAIITASQPGDESYNATTSQQTITVSKYSQSITFELLSEKTYGDGSFDLEAHASSGLEITYESSDETVATISGKVVTIIGAGNTTITASQPGDEEFDVASDVAQVLTVNRAPQLITFETIGEKAANEKPFDLIATSSSDLEVSFSSSDETVATISGNTVSILSSGTTTITAIQAGNANYLPASEEQILSVSDVTKLDQTITFVGPDDRVFGDAPFELSATATSGLVVSFESSDESVATVSGSTVTIVGAGSTTITATQNGDQDYLSAESVGQPFEVSTAELVVTPDDQEVVYGEALPEFTYSISGFVNGEDEQVLLVQPQAGAGLSGIPDAGVYEITSSGGEAANYSFVYTEGVLTILKATASIVMTDLEQEEDGTGKRPEVTTEPADLNFVMTFNGDAEEPVTAGSYEVIVEIIETNYTGSATGTLVITSEQVLSAPSPVRVNVYPNPASSHILVKTPEVAICKLYELDGGLVQEGRSNEPMDISRVEAGIYILQILSEGKVIDQVKVIKKN